MSRIPLRVRTWWLCRRDFWPAVGRFSLIGAGLVGIYATVILAVAAGYRDVCPSCRGDGHRPAAASPAEGAPVGAEANGGKP